MKTSQYMNINSSLAIIALLIIKPDWLPTWMFTLMPKVLVVSIVASMIIGGYKAVKGD